MVGRGGRRLAGGPGRERSKKGKEGGAHGRERSRKGKQGVMVGRGVRRVSRGSW